MSLGKPLFYLLNTGMKIAILSLTQQMLNTGKITTEIFWDSHEDEENFLRIPEELDDLLISPFKVGGVNY